jgi:glycerol-3-phosphate acyltransferase PlsX
MMAKEKKLAGILALEREEAIGMGDSADEIRRKRRHSTINSGLRGVEQKKFDAFISAGNTAAVVMLSTLVLRRIHNQIRPAIAVPLPNEAGPCLILDAGAIPQASDIDLVNCARMGSIYVREIWGISDPIVRLLNIGREESKGNEIQQRANQTLEFLKDDGKLNFQGNIEGDVIYTDPVNVICCPGEIGNNTIKVSEGVIKLVSDKLGLFWKLFTFFYAHHKKTDSEEVGGAIILGLNGIVIKAHGKSRPLGIANAIRRAKMEVGADIVSVIRQAIENENEKDEEEPVAHK